MFKLTDYNVTRYSFNLSNGTHVVFFNKPNSPISMETSFICGGRFDSPNKKGLSHFAEHLILSGTKNYPSKDVIAGFIEELGGSIGASTGSDLLSIEISLGESSDIKYGIEMLSEILTNSLFNEKSIETERKAILRELAAKKSNPSKMLGEISKSLLYQDTVLEYPTIGSIESINSITKDDLLKFYNSNFHGNKCGITICGDIDVEELKELLENKFKISSGSSNPINGALPIFRNKKSTFLYFDNNNLEMELGFRTTQILDDDVRPLGFIASILSGGRTGSLKKKLRYERGLVYSIGAGVVAHVDGGSFNISCGISKDTTQEVMDIICEEINRMATKGPTEEELMLSKNRIIKSVRIPMQTTHSWVSRHNYKNLFFPNLNWTIEDDLLLAEKVTTEDIKRVAVKYLNKDNWYLSMTGPVAEELINNVKINI